MPPEEQQPDEDSTRPPRNDEAIEPIEEDVAPADNRVIRGEKPTHRETTRRLFAMILIWTLVGLAAVGGLGWLLYGDDAGRMRNFAIIFSPVTTLIGTIIGFYYSSPDDR